MSKQLNIFIRVISCFDPSWIESQSLRFTHLDTVKPKLNKREIKLIVKLTVLKFHLGN